MIRLSVLELPNMTGSPDHRAQAGGLALNSMFYITASTSGMSAFRSGASAQKSRDKCLIGFLVDCVQVLLHHQYK